MKKLKNDSVLNKEIVLLAMMARVTLSVRNAMGFSIVLMEPMNSIVCISFVCFRFHNAPFLFIFIGPDKPGPQFTPINKRLWPFWERFFVLSFAWESVPTYSDGRAQLCVNVPHVIGTWVVSAFSISQQAGLTVLPNVLTV